METPAPPKEALSWEEAKNQVAKKQGWQNWNHYEQNYTVGLGATMDNRLEEAAKLFRSSAIEND